MNTTRTPDGVLRKLGLTPSKRFGAGELPDVPTFSAALVLPTELEEYDSWPASLQVLDQGSWNACTYFASAQALMYARYQSGQPYVLLDPLYPYFLVTGGQNIGTNILQAATVLAASGMPPKGSTQRRLIEVRQQAQRFRLELSLSLISYDQLLSEVARRRPVVGSVFVGRNYHELDADGAMGVNRGEANHAIFLGGGLKFSKTHGWMIKHCGSYGTRWGQNGFAWYTESHFDNAGFGEAYTMDAVHEDLADTDNPPEVMA